MAEVQIVDDFWNREAGWRLVPQLSSAGFLTYEKVEGSVTYHRKVYGATDGLLEQAKAERDAHEGRRFPLDRGFVIGSLPLNLRHASGYAEAEKNEDMNWIRRAWNSDERFQPFKRWRKTI